MLRDFGMTIGLEGDAEGEGLGNRLNRERAIVVASFVNASGCRGEADAEVFRIRFSQFGNIGGDLPVCRRQEPAMDRFDGCLQFMFFRRVY